MKVKVQDSKTTPKWVKLWNLLNLFITGIALGYFWGTGWELESSLLLGYSFYCSIYLLTIGHYFTPKKKVEFPKEFIQHLKNRFSTI